MGPNDADSLTTAHGLPGDTDLDTATADPTFDAAALIFAFTTDTGDLFFDYVFASEEYNEFIESGVTDAFAFFVDGTNIALAPGTTDPVNINTVNCGNPFAPPSGGSNCSLFNNNDLQDDGPLFDIQYDGLSDVFTAAILGLGAGTHTTKLVVGDAGDEVLDSAVFLEAGSFSSAESGPASVAEPGTLALAGFGLAALGRVQRRRKA